MKRTKKIALLALAVLLVSIISVAAFKIWHGGVQWQITLTKEFTVYKDAAGAEVWPDSDFHQFGDIQPGVHTVNFYLRNTGEAEITVIVTDETPVECTATWDKPAGYFLPSDGTLMLAVLTLDITGQGSYDFDFETAA